MLPGFFFLIEGELAGMAEIGWPEDLESDLEELSLKGIKAIVALMENGAFFSRPYDLLAETIINRDGASRDAFRKLKAIFDPANIMNPGKLCF